MTRLVASSAACGNARAVVADLEGMIGLYIGTDVYSSRKGQSRVTLTPLVNR